MSGKKYNLILSDCPWAYSFSKSKSRRIENHYPPMKTDDIAALPVLNLCESSCVLFMWATAPKLKEALYVMDAWKFDYKTHGIWRKKRVGMGYYFRNNHELLLIGTRKKSPPPPKRRPKYSVFEGDHSKVHSKKPDAARELIEFMYPDDSKIELFARAAPVGWDVIGNAIDGKDIRDVLREWNNVSTL